jgi:hypothetical protein
MATVDRDTERVRGYLRGLPPLPLPPALASPDRILLRARLLARLQSLRGAAARSERPLWVAGMVGPAVAGLALLALVVRSLSSLAARDPLGLAAVSGLLQLLVIAFAAGLTLAVAIVLPLILVEE